METTELEATLEEEAFRPGTESSGGEHAEPSGVDPGRTIEYVVAETSLGTAIVGVTELGVCAVLLGDDQPGLIADLRARFPGRRLREEDVPGPWATRVLACIDGAEACDKDLPLDPKGTDFQKAVWAALREIPAGTTVTYSAVAARIGRPTSVRAVARACGANPLAVVVPCHRVLRGDGSISGYRWGVERKRRLLDRERTSSTPGGGMASY